MTDTPSEDIDVLLMRYLAARDQQRAEAVESVLAGLTPRERLLVKEAAVMGFVRGTIHGGGHSAPPAPADSRIVVEVVNACLSMPDIYPTLGGSREV
jgi:hypothetical protein